MAKYKEFSPEQWQDINKMNWEQLEQLDKDLRLKLNKQHDTLNKNNLLGLSVSEGKYGEIPRFNKDDVEYTGSFYNTYDPVEISKKKNLEFHKAQKIFKDISFYDNILAKGNLDTDEANYYYNKIDKLYEKAEDLGYEDVEDFTEKIREHRNNLLKEISIFNKVLDDETRTVKGSRERLKTISKTLDEAGIVARTTSEKIATLYLLGEIQSQGYNPVSSETYSSTQQIISAKEILDKHPELKRMNYEDMKSQASKLISKIRNEQSEAVNRLLYGDEDMTAEDVSSSELY